MTWVIVAGAVAAAYGYSLWRHPYRACWRCHGSKSHVGQAWRGAFGNCWACEGSGLRIRWGVRLFMPGTARAIRAGQHGRNY